MFQGRFKSVPVENSAWGYEGSLYIHLNPVMLVRLGLGKREKKAESLGWKAPDKEQVSKRLAELRKFKWSSYPCYAGYKRIPEWLTVGDILRCASNNECERQKKYRSDAKQRIAKGLPEDIEQRLKEGFALGAEKFRKRVKESGKTGREIAGKTKVREKVDYSDLVRCVEEIRGKKASEFLSVRGDWGKPLLMWGARRYCGLSLREVGDKLGGVDYAAVSIMLKRFERKAMKDKNVAGRIKELKGQM